MTPNSGAGAGEEKAVSWRHFILIIMCEHCSVTMIILGELHDYVQTGKHETI